AARLPSRPRRPATGASSSTGQTWISSTAAACGHWPKRGTRPGAPPATCRRPRPRGAGGGQRRTLPGGRGVPGSGRDGPGSPPDRGARQPPRPRISPGKNGQMQKPARHRAPTRPASGTTGNAADLSAPSDSAPPDMFLPPYRRRLQVSLEPPMIILGVILLIIGFIAKIAIIWTIGIVVVVIGAILALLGLAGHAVGGRRHYF